MNRDQIRAILPYGDGFLWLDRVTAIEPGVSIDAETEYSADNPFLDAHFKAGPKIVPGFLLAEQMCQAAMLADHRLNTQPRRYLLGQARLRFEHPAIMPCTVSCGVTVTQHARDVLAINGKAYVEGVGLVARLEALASPAGD